jgi:hypothetical protein
MDSSRVGQIGKAQLLDTPKPLKFRAIDQAQDNIERRLFFKQDEVIDRIPKDFLIAQTGSSLSLPRLQGFCPLPPDLRHNP